ncbi:XRE family transcriptional regulator [Singulisphaera sp. PoT]|uniref:XRE family transcriptional regulator n=1 Tax=Singulisphaera sp. PoT TaxID=3411797 RepID=UPI003BF58333
MARKKTPKVRVNIKASVSRRLREVRQDLFGEHGGPELARRLGLPARTWYNYETGVTVPAEVLLAFIDQTGANPSWLLSGIGPKFVQRMDASLSDLTPLELIRKGLEKLEEMPSDAVVVAPENLPTETMSDFVAVSLVSPRDLSRKTVDPSRVKGYIMAYRQWLPNPENTVGVRLEDDTMSPILPEGSVVAIDRTVTDPAQLQGKMVAACPDGAPMIRWLDVTGRHLILRPNQPSRENPLIPIELEGQIRDLIIGQVVWSWSRFSES